MSDCRGCLGCMYKSNIIPSFDGECLKNPISELQWRERSAHSAVAIGQCSMNCLIKQMCCMF